ncbi:biogenesis of lysosome-related organelles complex 1 subunit 5 isoform X1 [Huso huso]|uniref:Biogenesis of lysosome-related organelles complex 1 subunit 5 n=2 Tax=Acipenseridae TaxID=7900 RepID=A0AAD8GDX6_ACIOX|nr:biogenesis of lysosome-related organelles complex 1 subunit 5 [Acipenser ruthenus]KAK1172416.1 biogenesis of lysosome-related organelles complex 1 subunit 5 isoform X1 [Acipenser oxyrinchus oxyrinchus]
MDKIAKDIGDIQSRLLDHRPVVQGEIRFFVREFEEKRGLREKRLLENLNNMIIGANDQTIPKCTEAMQHSLLEALTRLEAANHMAQRIHLREQEAQQSTKLHACQERRKAEWEAFMKEQTVKKEAMDEEHAKAVGRLSTHYSDMKKDLTKFAPF